MKTGNSKRQPGQFLFGGLPFYCGTLQGVLHRIDEWIGGRGAYICVTGIHGLAQSAVNNRVFEAHKHASLVVPDGMPIITLGKLKGYPMERIYGPDLLLAVCGYAETARKNIFLYGTTQQTLMSLQRALLKKFPDLAITGSFAPPFRALTRQEDIRVTQMLNASKAHIVLVGLSTPKQEVWMSDHHSDLRGRVLIGVGAAFDFISGTKAQAPRWMQRSGLEWLFRLVHEPVRLAPRYAISAGVVLWLIMRDGFRNIGSRRS